jgi:hypothetical protein
MFVEIPEGQKPFAGTKHIKQYENMIKMDPK